MFSCPTTRMTAAARSAPLPAYADSPARQSLVYCLVFLIAILSQSILQIPFVIWHLIATDALQNLASLDTAAISDAIAQAMHHLMPARLYTTLGTFTVAVWKSAVSFPWALSKKALWQNTPQASASGLPCSGLP